MAAITEPLWRDLALCHYQVRPKRVSECDQRCRCGEAKVLNDDRLALIDAAMK